MPWRRWSVAVALTLPLLVVTAVATPAAAATFNAGQGMSTNYNWASLVLEDGGWPTSTNNDTVLTQWMASEEPPSNWWNQNNPLNDSLGLTGSKYANLPTAAYYVALNLESSGNGYPAIAADLAASDPPKVTAKAIWASDWASGHYGNGADWFTGTAATVSAPDAAWGAAALAVTAPTAPAAMVGQPYGLHLSAKGGIPPYTWSLAGPAPPGLSVSTSGVLSGTPLVDGSYEVTAKVKDATGTSSTGRVAVTVTGPQLLAYRPIGSSALYAKSGLSAAWATQADRLAGTFSMSGSTMALLTPGGALYAKDLPSGAWVEESSGVAAYAVGPGYLVMRPKGSDELLAKDGLDGTWAVLAKDLPGSFSLAGGTLADLTPTGTLYARDLTSGLWHVEATGVASVAVGPDRLVMRPLQSTAILEMEGLSGSWSILASDLPGQLTLSGYTLTDLTASGLLYAKDLPAGPWLLEASHVTAAAVSPDTLVVRQGSSSALLGKDGLASPWTTLTGNLAGSIAVSGSTLTVLTPGGALYARQLVTGSWDLEALHVAAVAADG